jgi:hypothetical protein
VIGQTVEGPLRIGRLSVDILGSIPLREAAVEVSLIKPGRRGATVEWRFTRGSFDSLGAADVWARVRLPLVDGVALTGQDRVLITADSANGLSLSLPLTQWLSIPPAMTATLLRPPVGEWMHLACRTWPD